MTAMIAPDARIGKRSWTPPRKRVHDAAIAHGAITDSLMES
jgi:hypothetical protein